MKLLIGKEYISKFNLIIREFDTYRDVKKGTKVVLCDTENNNVFFSPVHCMDRDLFLITFEKYKEQEYQYIISHK
ncbi:hypothetical protein LJB88_05290 [Erysipelotrichaceae bacterium OttesenSCG-928-M19]|nr:hypothetical protein [Erysipelotrichaceae bacterium OttesenSCG-928-M19]